jgi:Carboxypeptidase regulatory-like domain
MVAAWVALVWLTAQPASAQARATLRGTLRTAAGAPQPNVTINVVNLDTENERQVITEADGAWTMGGLLPGRYEIRIDEAGFAPLRQAVTLTAGQDSTQNVTLRPAAAPAPPPPMPAPPAVVVPDYIPSPDRWRLDFPVWQRYPPDVAGHHPYTDGRTLDPYNRNVLKGDYPAFGTQDVFAVLTGVLETPLEYRRLPTPSGVSQARPGSDAFFGQPEQFAFASEAVGSLEIFKGDTSFKPRTWAIRVTPVFNLNYVNTGEYNIVNATPEEKKKRRRTDVALQEAFGEVKLLDVGPSYDFVSIRAGIQPFTSDFRGFLYRDTNLGVRLFGTFGRNRNQWNLAAFDQLQKDTNSELNLFERRDQKVLIANFFRQDFLTPGYTISPSFHANFDKGAGFFYDENGFLIQPSPIGDIRPHEVKAYYVGLGGDGHWGPLNVSHQFYQAFGTDEFNGISGRELDINAQFASAELSVDHDWWRLKGTFVYASGDRDPDDDQAKGFDAIFDNPNIAGGPFSFWNREGIRLTQTLVGLTARSSILPSLRSSKTEGQANFVNPGLLLYNAGFDADLTQKTRLSVNANVLRFQYTEVLQRVLFQQNIEKSIGMDYSVGVQWRPALNDQLVVTGGASIFLPSAGFKSILTTDRLFAPFVVLTLRY